jgi:hypothetical protein
MRKAMRKRAGWLGMMVLAMVLCATSAHAADAPAAAPATTPASEEACRAACGRLIDRCIAPFGPAMGDMRPSCTKVVLKRCRTVGLGACDVVAGDGR